MPAIFVFRKLASSIESASFCDKERGVFVRSLGADGVVDYTKETVDAAARGQRAVSTDKIIDAAGRPG